MRHIVVTGASSGLGRELALCFAIRGEALTLFGRHQQRLKMTETECRKAGATVQAALNDVTDAESMKRSLTTADDERPIDIVIANAGIGGASVLAPPDGEPASLVRTIIEVNTLGAMNTVTAILPRFVSRRSGHIVIISSLAAYEGLPEAPAYSASKAAIRAYGHGLRRLLAGTGVTVTVICPGFIETPMSASLPMRPLFAWTATRAAAKIIWAIDQKKAEIVFPWQLALTVALTRILPLHLIDRLLAAGKSWTEKR